MNPMRILILLSIPTLTACATDSSVRIYGSLREALRDGQTEARVNLGDAVQSNTFAVGAAAELDGEITVSAGQCYVTRVRDGNLVTERTPTASATILFAAEVTKWQAIPVTEEIPAKGFDEFIHTCIESTGLDPQQAVPFRVEGRLKDLQLHVIAGECPIRARHLGTPMRTPPVRRRFDSAPGRLVGIYAANGGGVITHHGSPTHVHAIVGAAEFTGHCEGVGISKGAVVYLPAK